MNRFSVNKILNIILLILVVGFIANYFYRLPKYESGEKALDFTSTLLSGDTFSLSQLRGSYVLLDFWGSWCGPCRKENPDLVNLYNEMKDQKFKAAGSFQIVSIGIETKKDNWENAIQKDGLIWPYHIGEMDRFSGKIAKLYLSLIHIFCQHIITHLHHPSQHRIGRTRIDCFCIIRYW